MATPGSIWGVQCPRFKKGSSIVTLYRSVFESEELAKPRKIESESVINAHREWLKVGTGSHVDVVVRVNLYEYADPVKKYEEIIAYEDNDIDQFAPHKDKDYLKDSAGSYVEFHIESIVPKRIFQPHFYDVVFITFKSKDPVDLSKGLYTAILDDLDDSILDDLDSVIKE